MNGIETCVDNVVISGKDANKFVYLIKDRTSYSTRSFDKEVKIVNNTITYNSIHPLVVVSGILMGALFMMIIIPSFSREEGWEYKEVKSKVCLSYVRCEEEDGLFYYIYDNRFICKSNCIQNEWNILSVLRDYIGRKNLYPIYSTKSEKRDKKISEILK